MKYLAMIALSVALFAACVNTTEARGRLFQRRGCSQQSVQRTVIRQSGPVLSAPRAAASWGCAGGKCSVR